MLQHEKARVAGLLSKKDTLARELQFQLKRSELHNDTLSFCAKRAELRNETDYQG